MFILWYIDRGFDIVALIFAVAETCAETVKLAANNTKTVSIYLNI
jgi:hypothetical protein